MSWGLVAGAAVSVVGGVMSADAADDAAGAQQQASQQATAMQMMAAEQMRKDLAPWTTSGSAAQSRLNQYLGLGGVGSGGRTSMGLATGLTPAQVREQLLGRFTSNRASSVGSGTAANLSPMNQTVYDRATRGGANPAMQAALRDALVSQQGGAIGYSRGEGGQMGGVDAGGSIDTPVYGYGPMGGGTEIDEAGLQAAMDQYYREQDEQNRAAEADPTYGSLLRPYRGGAEFDSGPAFSFTGKDLEKEPGYQFGLNEGTKGINRGQAARGNFLSGGAMKELSRFNQDYAGTKFDAGFNRASSTYGTNLARRQNEWSTNLGAYNDNRNRIYNYLTGTSSLGQASAARVGSSNQQAAEGAASNLLAAGNARAAGIVGGSNALVSGINTAANRLTDINNPNSAAGWNSLIRYSGSSANPSAPNYENQMDRGY